MYKTELCISKSKDGCGLSCRCYVWWPQPDRIQTKNRWNEIEQNIWVLHAGVSEPLEQWSDRNLMCCNSQLRVFDLLSGVFTLVLPHGAVCLACAQFVWPRNVSSWCEILSNSALIFFSSSALSLWVQFPRSNDWWLSKGIKPITGSLANAFTLVLAQTRLFYLGRQAGIENQHKKTMSHVVVRTTGAVSWASGRFCKYS